MSGVRLAGFQLCGRRIISHDRAHHSQGYLLLEVMLAAAIFFMATAGLTQALTAMIDSEKIARRERELMIELQSFVNDASTIPLKEGEETIFENKTKRVTRTVKATDLQNKDGVQLNSIYEVTIKLSVKYGSDEAEKEVTYLVYEKKS